MTDTTVTSIRLPEPVYKEVEAEAARRDISPDEALGMCVAFLCELTTPLVWRGDYEQAVHDIRYWVEAKALKP